MTVRNILIIFMTLILGLISCESDRFDTDQGVILQIGTNIGFRYTDIELYDSSAHILYFKKYHPEIDTIELSKFSFYAEGNEVYSGSFRPPYNNSMPKGPFITSPLYAMPDFLLKVENLYSEEPDPRNDPHLIRALEERGLLHSGLSVTIDTIKISGPQLDFTFTVTNKDKSDLLIIDPNKTGPNLYHFFTNGLVLRNEAFEEVFSSDIPVYSPFTWNQWSPDWLSKIKSGESQQYSISYSVREPLTSGKYKALFEFPGLTFQVTKEELYQNESRIWLGNITAAKEIILR